MSTLTIDQDVASVRRIEAVPSILKVLCQMTGMGFAAVARVTDGSWTACAVADNIAFGLLAGGQLDVNTTLCKEVREARAPIAIAHASQVPVYCGHHTPTMYAIESYVSVPIVLANGDYFGNLCAIDPKPAIVDDERTVSTFVHFASLIGHELDSQRRNEAVLRELTDERHGSALREEFIAVLGHDLRNPLSAVSASANVLKLKRGDPEFVLDLANRILANVDRMSGLIEDVLDCARGRLGSGLPAEMAPVDDLPGVILGIVAESEAAHSGREIKTSLAIDRPMPGDPVRIQQLVSNLVSNALTHGAPDRPVAIRASTADGEFELTVHNEGEPIPEEAIPSIFGAFSGRDTSRRGQGLGLGLHICHQIVKAHSGQLTVTSTRLGGTTFKARLPAV